MAWSRLDIFICFNCGGAMIELLAKVFPRKRICIFIVAFISSIFCLQGENTPVLPELVNKYENRNNEGLANMGPMHEPCVEDMWRYNIETIHKILKMDSETTRKELEKRLKDNKNSMDVRLLYAGILASLNNEAGQVFLMESGRSAAKMLDAQNAFWMIVRLDCLYPYEERKSNSVDMKWAESFMLEILKTPKTLEAKNWANGKYERQVLAIENFGEILAMLKSKELYPVLIDFWNDSSSKVGRWQILPIFEKMEDRRTIPILLEALNEKEQYKSAAYALAAMRAPEAIPILLTHLDDSDTYLSLAKYNDARILPALKEALPGLTKDYAKGAARLMIINLEGGDRLPKLIEIAQDPNFKSIEDPLQIICSLKDARSVPFAIKELNSSPELYRRFVALNILGAIDNSPEAIKGLINAFEINVNAIAKGKEICVDNNKRFSAIIARHLKQLTGHDFGEDKKKWLEYYQKNYNPAK